MGFIEVIRNLPTILGNIAFCKKDIGSFRPDVIIFIDYPGFNLRIAKWAKEQSFRTVYYISPQVWAWKENRVRMIRECIDKMLVILPFEKEFYRKWNYEVDYVGHPLVEVIEEFGRTEDVSGYEFMRGLGGKKIIALLPGSRRQEILKKLPLMLEMSRIFTDYCFVLAQAPGQDRSLYDDLLKDYPQVKRVNNQTYALLSHAYAACVTSGTATLETALFGVAEVVCYRASAISYQIARRLVKVKYISLVNLIMDKMVVRELIQDEFNRKNLEIELKRILFEEKTRAQLKSDYEDLKNLLKAGGNASSNAAHLIWKFLGNPGF
jgi:lipid-A-disaccharide synthase